MARVGRLLLGLVVAIVLLGLFRSTIRQPAAAVITTRKSSWQQFQSNRTLALVHIGKAGGLTLRAMTSLKCRLPRNRARPESIRDCLITSFGTTTTTAQNPLALQTIYYAHMGSAPPSELTAATSWLLVVRNPVDRVVSAFRYSHPANCRDAILLPNSTKACTNYFILQNAVNLPQSQKRNVQQLARVFQDCFPQAAVEVFGKRALLDAPEDACSRLARAYLLGKGPIFPIPHLHYNYRHYRSKVMDVYDTPEKEWFGIRTEHLQEDFASLDRQLGGTETTTKAVKLTHGSEQYQSNLLSPETYQGLCCLFVDEITIYLDWVQRMWNWNGEQKAATFEELAHKCGMIQSADEDWNRLWETWKIQTCGSHP